MPTLTANGDNAIDSLQLNSPGALSANCNSSPQNYANGTVSNMEKSTLRSHKSNWRPSGERIPTIETILRQQRHDRETRAALVVLEGGKNFSALPPPEPGQEDSEKGKRARESSERKKKIDPYKNLLVLRRIEL